MLPEEWHPLIASALEGSRLRAREVAEKWFEAVTGGSPSIDEDTLDILTRLWVEMDYGDRDAVLQILSGVLRFLPFAFDLEAPVTALNTLAGEMGRVIDAASHGIGPVAAKDVFQRDVLAVCVIKLIARSIAATRGGVQDEIELRGDE